MPGTRIFANSLAVLDPSVKLVYAKDQWDAELLEDAIDNLKSVMHSFPVPLFLSLNYAGTV